MPNLSFTKIVKTNHETMILREFENELKKHGTVWKYHYEGNTAHFKIENDEILTVTGEIKSTVNNSKNSTYVELVAKTKRVRSVWWWFWLTILLIMTGGIAIGYAIYHFIKIPKNSTVLKNTQNLMNSALDNLTNKCESLA